MHSQKENNIDEDATMEFTETDDAESRCMRLPGELKLKILEKLHGVDVTKMSCVCTELLDLTLGGDLWKRKFLEQFGFSASAFPFPATFRPEKFFQQFRLPPSSYSYQPPVSYHGENGLLAILFSCNEGHGKGY